MGMKRISPFAQKNKKVIACRGTKNIYEVNQGVAKMSFTVMFTFGAKGDVTPRCLYTPIKESHQKKSLLLYLKNGELAIRIMAG